MDLPYDDAIKLFDSWSKLERLPVLEALLQVRSLAAIHVIVEGVAVSPEELTLSYGRKACGAGTIVLPLHQLRSHHARITVLTPDDNPNSLRHPNASQVARWIDFRFIFSDIDTGCLITEYKPTMGFLAITGFGPLDVAFKAREP
jgi:hypothetical protein